MRLSCSSYILFTLHHLRLLPSRFAQFALMSVISALRRRSTVSNHSHPPVARSHRRSTSVSSPQQPQQEHHRRRSNSSSLNLHHAGILVAELLPSEKSMLVASAQATRHRRVSGQQVSPVMNHDQIACLEGPAPHSE